MIFTRQHNLERLSLLPSAKHNAAHKQAHSYERTMPHTNMSTQCRIRGSCLQWEKNESQKFNGCPILSQAIGQEKLRTVFVFALAHLEGPPQAFAGYNSKFK